MKNILITGGTGRLGQALLKHLSNYNVTTLSRSATQGNHIQADICNFTHYQEFDIVIHCAAMKDAVACESQIDECIRTNVTATQFSVDAAIRSGVGRYIYISTDMAVEPQGVYGASKKLAEAVVVNAARCSSMQTAVIRFGNIIGHTGSIFDTLATKAAQLGYVPITDHRMTRFLMSSDECADFVIQVTQRNELWGEIFVPRCSSYRIMDIASVVAPSYETRIVGLRPGDALEVTIISKVEAPRTTAESDMLRILPAWSTQKPTTECGELTSSNNQNVATERYLREIYKNCSTFVK